ncbi:unnamed protein product [Arctia plantaginis]|uniref:Sec20 C-terminal domain-containing protein n=1 Tax=Arctia plantaginis TaxID=874455 RepID=A0A8S1AU01_ARCPL|nr:unnamed protein product [Arctia plantaginis]
MSSNDEYQKLFKKLEDADTTYKNFVKKFAKYHFQVKAIIQDILECRESMETLNKLNEKGRTAISQLRDELESLELYGKEMGDMKYSLELDSQRHQLACLLKEFKEANLCSMFKIEKAQREELLKAADGDNTSLRNRKNKVDRDGLLKMCNRTALSISRQLADTAQRSQNTLDNLVSSSTTVHGTQSELQNTASTISQSGKLLKKYGRREFTDKVIMFFAFLFFLAVCLYIVQKRIF